MQQTSPHYIGIDFGTSKSVLTWYEPERGFARVIRNSEGQEETPSVVYFGENEVLVGQEALNILSDDGPEAENVILSVKSQLRRPDLRFLVPGHPTPVDASVEIFKKLKREFDKHFRFSVTRVVVTYPANFDVTEKNLIERAAKLAGFFDVHLLEEPVAAAIAYSRNAYSPGSRFLVYDLGAGTFDLALLGAQSEGGSKSSPYAITLPPRGLRLGGDDLDRELYNWCNEIAQEKLGRPICINGAQDLKFLMECRRRKENLSSKSDVDFSSVLRNPRADFRFRLTQAEFDQRIAAVLRRTLSPIREIIAELESGASGGEAKPLESVVLVGGSSQIPAVRKMIQENFPIPVRDWGELRLAVGFGAAYHAYELWKEPTQHSTKRTEQAPPRVAVRYVLNVEPSPGPFGANLGRDPRFYVDWFGSDGKSERLMEGRVREGAKFSFVEKPSPGFVKVGAVNGTAIKAAVRPTRLGELTVTLTFDTEKGIYQGRLREQPYA